MKRILALILTLLTLPSFASALSEDFQVIQHGDREQKRVAVTVDDCFSIETTQLIFELAKEHDVPLTFFILGINLEDKDAEIWQEIAASSCEIGNHTYGHRSFNKLNSQSIYAQINQAQASLDRVLGYHYPMQVLRPPYGHYNQTGKRNAILGAIEKFGYDNIILWDVSQTDFKKCTKDVENGSILLFHTNKKDYNCLVELIPWLKEQGYELVTVSEMIGKDPVVPTDEVYEYVYYKDWLAQREEEQK